ncbi:MAG: hypothetical protein KIH01_08200 [Candidatus Freyarchaeota archaeon]|nr:hypothetical protein [Candidatus Jordarchaeia archaeon]
MEKVDGADTISDVFGVVERVVLEELNAHRPVMLGLADLGVQGSFMIGAFHPVGSNLIVLNRAPLERIGASAPKALFNAYCFHILLHEYLHSLGVLNEQLVREMVYEISKKFLGEEHPATLMGVRGVAHFFPFIMHYSPGTLPELRVEIIRGFKQQSSSYFV